MRKAVATISLIASIISIFSFSTGLISLPDLLNITTQDQQKHQSSHSQDPIKEKKEHIDNETDGEKSVLVAFLWLLIKAGIAILGPLLPAVFLIFFFKEIDFEDIAGFYSVLYIVLLPFSVAIIFPHLVFSAYVWRFIHSITQIFSV